MSNNQKVFPASAACLLAYFQDSQKTSNQNLHKPKMKYLRILQLTAAAGAMAIGSPAFALIITPTFTSAFVTDFGANAALAEASWIAAANVYQTDFSDPININITVNAVTGTSVFGASSTSLYTYGTGDWTTVRNLMLADSKTANDATALGVGGSMPVADPTGGTGTFWFTRAEGKAIGAIPNDNANDGTTTFGAGNPFTFAGPIAAGTYDFQGVAAHEISEVMGRLGLKGSTISGYANSYSIVDAFSYTGAGTRSLAGGAGAYFSIDNGTTLIKQYNNYLSNGLDSRDWAPGSNDSFNQFSNSGVQNPVTAVDLQELDVIGYDLIAVPEPTTGALVLAGLAIGAVIRRRSSAK